MNDAFSRDFVLDESVFLPLACWLLGSADRHLGPYLEYVHVTCQLSPHQTLKLKHALLVRLQASHMYVCVLPRSKDKRAHALRHNTHSGARWTSRLGLQLSVWQLSKAPLYLFPVSVFFNTISRYFPWCLACCRWVREKLYVCIINSPSACFPAKYCPNLRQCCVCVCSSAALVFCRL